MPELFPVYSIAKSFIAQAVLELDVSLSESIGSHLPSLSDTYSHRTIGSLLNHTSGLADYSELADYHAAVEKLEPAWSREILLERSEKLNNERSSFTYSNVGYLLLRMLMEHKTGLSTFEAVKQLVLAPLTIDGFFEWETSSQVVSGYDPRWVYSGTFLADREALLEGFLKLAKHRANTVGLRTGCVSLPYKETGFDKPAYGFGFMSDLPNENAEPLYVGHGGGGPGFSHMILVNTKTWKVALESSTTEIDQAAAIRRLKYETSN